MEFKFIKSNSTYNFPWIFKESEIEVVKYIGLANSIPSNSLATTCCGGERGRGRKAINEVIKNRQLPSAKHGGKRRKIKKRVLNEREEKRFRSKVRKQK